MLAPEYGQFPLRSFLGFDVREVGKGIAEATSEVADHHLNPNGVVHGAVMFALIDTAMGKATMSILGSGEYCASIESSVRYLQSVKSGRLIARVRVLKAGRRVVQLEGRVTVDGSDDPVLVASGSFAVIRGVASKL